MPPGLGTGALESPKDPRDWTPESVGAAAAVADAITLDHATDLQITMQGQLGTCVGNTFEEIVRYLTGPTQAPLSWRFVYAVCKAIEGTVQPTGDYRAYARTAGADDGTYPALAAQVIRKYGVPLAKYCPNDISLTADAFCYNRVLANIPPAAIMDAATRKSGADIAFPATQAGIMQALAYAKQNKGIVAILRRIGDTYWTANGVSTYDKAKLLPIKPTSAVVSGHEELLYAYDTEAGDGRIRIYWQNHWDVNWCSTGGSGKDGGRAWEYLDVWLPYIVEVRVVVPALPPAPADFRYTFTKNLVPHSQGPDVVALQHILDLEGCYTYQPTDGSPKYTGNYLGETEKSVVKLQEKYASEILTPLGLVHGTGLVYASTLAWLNKHYGAN